MLSVRSTDRYFFFRLYQILFGLYLAVHYYFVLHDCIEIFSNKGTIKDSAILPGYGKLPNILFYYDSPNFVFGYVLSLLVASIFLIIDFKCRLASLYLWYGLFCLFNRNPFISNPGLPFIGWILLSFVLIPEKRRNQFKLPKEIYYGFWLITALSYTISGIHKLQCPSWIDGTALEHVLSGVLARDNSLVKFLLMSDIGLKVNTWISLFGETTFLFFGLFENLRPFYWLLILGLHIGVILTVNFTDLTLGMLIAHLYLFDLDWIRKFRMIKFNWIKPALINLSFWTVISCVVLVDPIYSFLNNLKMNSFNAFIIMGLGMIFSIVLENIYPNYQLPESKNWYIWAIGINLFQLCSSIIGSYTYEKYLSNTFVKNNDDRLKLSDYVSPFFGGVIGQILNLWIFYWWHHLRHQINFLWVYIHQFHHSPKRIETLTSFFKHPIEIVIDSIIMSIIAYPLLGLTPESSIWMAIFSAFGEYFYHMNVKTPEWIGSIFQRPESHRIHHRQNARINCPNNSDNPLWDILNNTYENCTGRFDYTGFTDENKRLDIIKGKDIIKKTKSKSKIDWRTLSYYVLIVWGTLSCTLFLFQSPYSRLPMISMASPLPLVFSNYNGVETFSTEYVAKLEYSNCTKIVKLDRDIYKNLGGCYNKRNIYGAVFSYGPLFDENRKELINMRNSILNYAVCEPGLIIQEMGLGEPKNITIYTTSKTKGSKMDIWIMNVFC